MKLIHNKVLVDVGNNEHLLLNTLNGKIDLLYKEHYNIFTNWADSEIITPRNDVEEALYNALLAGGYLVESTEVELKEKASVLEKLREAHEKKRNSFHSLSFVLTYDCNFNCSYCYEQGNVKYNNQMTKEMVNAALELTQDNVLTEVKLFGGEPLLPKNKEVVEHIFNRCKDKRFQITTNGYTLLDYLDLFEGHKFSNIQVTLDGPAEFHNKKRFLADGSPTFARIIEGIAACLGRGHPIHIRMNVDSKNVEECINLRTELLEKWSMHSELLSFEMYPLFQLEPEAMQNVMDKLSLEDINKSPEELSKMNASFATFRPIVNYFINGVVPQPLYAFCDAHGGSAFVDPLGDIYTCILSLGKRELTVGTYYPVKQWKENSILMRNVENIPECSACEYALLCGGGCPLPLGHYEDVFRPVCASIKEEIHSKIPYFFNLKRKSMQTER